MPPPLETGMEYHLVRLSPEDQGYPEGLRCDKCGPGHGIIMALGNIDILKDKSLAIFCSTKCPGQLILHTYDMARSLRQAGVTVVGGFHSPMERECLSLLLRGKQPVIICPARSLQGMRITPEWKLAIAEGRLLLLSPFGEHLRRPTVALAQTRNELVATIATVIFVAHAAVGGKTEQFCVDALTGGKSLITLQSAHNAHLIGLGARPIQPDDINQFWAKRERAEGSE
jgi:predicted Rossmann fold nucleotide-binding protein DprA/Smf involved in DNA uptake